MPRKKKTHQTDPNGVHDFRHADARRPNNPPAGTAPIDEVREGQARQYARGVYSDPQRQWAGKAEHISFKVR